MQDTIQTIRSASYRFFGGTLLSRISGMARDMSMAYAFGTQPSIAAFMIAFRFAHLLRRLFGEGALQSAFIPQFESLRHQNEERAFLFFRHLTGALALFLSILIGFSCCILAGVTWWTDLSANTREVIYLTLVMLPSLLFICLFGLNSSLLQCEKSYFTPSIAPVAFNAIWIACVFFIRHLPIAEAMPWLALGVVFACFSQWLLTVPQTWKSMAKASFRDHPSGDTPLSDLRLLWRPLMLGLFGVAASQINNAVDALFARYAESEGPAFLWYAIRLQQLPLALFSIAIAGALLPPLARARKAQRIEEHDCFLQDALYRTWTFVLPLSAALLLVGDTCVQLLYGRGDFGPQSVVQTTYCLWAYSIGLLPSALILILAPASYAQNNYSLPARASCAALVINGLLNTLFITWLGWGAVSVALATSISAWINCLWLGSRLYQTGTSLFSLPLLMKGGCIGLATASALWESYQVRIQVPQLLFFSKDLLFSSLLEQCLLLSTEISVFGSLLLLNIGICHYLAKQCVSLRWRRSRHSMKVNVPHGGLTGEMADLIHH